APAQHPRERRSLLAIEVGFEAMSDGFMQQDPRPPRTQHHFHLASRRLASIELNEALPRRFLGEMLRRRLPLEIFQGHAATTTSRATRRARNFVLGDAENTHARHGLVILS